METDLLTDDRFRGSLKKDLALVSMAARRFGARLKEAGPEVIDRLVEIVKKKTVSTLTSEGDVVDVESLADANSIKAAEIILRAVAIDQKDDHHADRIANPVTPPSIAIQVNNGGNIGTTSTGGGRASAIAERLRADRLLARSAGVVGSADSD